MRRRLEARGRIIPVLVGCFAAGAVSGWIVRGSYTGATRLRTIPIEAKAELASASAPKAPATAPASTTTPPSESGSTDPVQELRDRHLMLPIAGAKIEAMKGEFGDLREGRLPHEAVDILAPRNTPIHAVENGTIAKLFLSKAGGTTIYEFDPSKRFCYYYAHLQRYADNLREGLSVMAGDVIGYVGTSGNAPPNTPHLHFSIFVLTPEQHWWQGKAVDPYLVFSRDGLQD